MFHTHPPTGNPVIINGYILKERHRLTSIAQALILILYGRETVKGYFLELGKYYDDGRPLNNLVHLVRNPLSATQYKLIGSRFRNLFRSTDMSADDLPF